MIYEIQNKSDFQTGVTLIIKIPEQDLDKKAFYTILAEKPDFVLPFRYRTIDGEIEFIYQIGNLNKFTYLSRERLSAEYASMWSGILQPLLDCGDWFLNPYSFVLNCDYLYCKKDSNAVSYIYIPSIQVCSDYNALKKMVTNIAKQNHVTDIKLENKVVWAIQEFNPSLFLKMLKPYEVQEIEKESVPIQLEFKQLNNSNFSEVKPVETKALDSAPKKADDIAIQFPMNNKASKEEKPKGGIFGFKKEKTVKTKNKENKKNGFWGKKKEQQKEIVQGAAEAVNQPDFLYGQMVNPLENQMTEVEEDNVTQIEMGLESVKFRYIGNGNHPKVIYVEVNEEKVFTIGRFDASIGVKQSSFEFDKKTKGVSRHHAAVEQGLEGYSIVDLSSSAGTFLNGKKLPPNTPFALKNGNQVSFGDLGADYIWEE